MAPSMVEWKSKAILNEFLGSPVNGQCVRNYVRATAEISFVQQFCHFDCVKGHLEMKSS